MATPHSAICPRLIGRMAYLESVSLLLGQMRQGNGHTLLLAGEAGIGKSRLIAEIKTGIRRDTALALQGNCFEPDRSLPYGPLIDALRALLAIIPPAELMRDAGTYAIEYARLLPELVAYLPADATAPLISPEQEKRRFFEALVQLLSRLSARQPLLF